MIYIKDNPVGIDIAINDIQLSVSDALGWVNYNAYHRAYKNETANGIKPEVFKVGNTQRVGEYEEVLLNDMLTASSFFYTDDTISTVDVGRLYNTTLSMVFQCDLSELEGVNSRDDEEVHRRVVLAINKSTYGKVNSIITGISNVYSEFNTDNINWDDMQPFHVFRVDIDISYEYNCCENCIYESPIIGNDVVLF